MVWKIMQKDDGRQLKDGAKLEHPQSDRRRKGGVLHRELKTGTREVSPNQPGVRDLVDPRPTSLPEMQTRVEVWFCPNCEAMLRHEFKFCPNCGYNLQGSEGDDEE